MFSKQNYKDGKLEGEQLWYDEDGQLKKTEIYEDGKLIETVRQWNLNWFIKKSGVLIIARLIDEMTGVRVGYEKI